MLPPVALPPVAIEPPLFFPPLPEPPAPDPPELLPQATARNAAAIASHDEVDFRATRAIHENCVDSTGDPLANDVR
jgi:hypothetical protein